jgi:hypothetical protein
MGVSAMAQAQAATAVDGLPADLPVPVPDTWHCMFHGMAPAERSKVSANNGLLVLFVGTAEAAIHADVRVVIAVPTAGKAIRQGSGKHRHAAPAIIVFSA